MTNSTLYEFTLDLCDTIVSQIRAGLGTLPEHDIPQETCSESLRYDDFHRQTLALWLARGVARLPSKLADYIRQDTREEKVSLPLNDFELNDLEALFADPPMSCEASLIWKPDSELYRCSVDSVPEIQSQLTRQNAEDWAKDSARFTSLLARENLPCAEGMQITREWLRTARRLLEVMYGPKALPASRYGGLDATPTQPAGLALPTVKGVTPERMSEAIDAIRQIIKASNKAEHDKPEVIIEKAGVSNHVAREVLRWLERLGEYNGWTRKRPKRYQSPD